MFADENTSVQHNQIIASDFGDRQFDVIVTRNIAPLGEIRIGIEARDHKRKGSITQIDGFVSKLDDCASTIHKGIMVNQRGFSANAMKKAKRKGIGLYRLEDQAYELKSESFALPVVITEHKVEVVVVEGEYKVDKSLLINSRDFLFNGQSFSELCLDTIYGHDGLLFEGTILITPIKTLKISGETVQPRNMQFNIHVTTRHHFGHLNELPETIVLKGQTGEEDKALIRLESLLKVHRSWPRFWNLKEVPKHVGIVTGASISPVIEQSFIDQFLANPSMSSAQIEKSKTKQYRFNRD